jgi:hypothetical protein
LLESKESSKGQELRIKEKSSHACDTEFPGSAYQHVATDKLL